MAKTIRKGIELDESELTIDELRLDRECVRQPKLYFAAAKRAADARAAMEEAKSAVDLERAEVDSAIREDPSKFGLEKVTESAISKAIELDRDFIGAKEAFAKARYELDICQAFVNALDHKKSMLGHLVSLHGQNFFSDVPVKEPAARASIASTRDRSVADRTRRALGERR